MDEKDYQLDNDPLAWTDGVVLPAVTIGVISFLGLITAVALDSWRSVAICAAILLICVGVAVIGAIENIRGVQDAILVELRKQNP